MVCTECGSSVEFFSQEVDRLEQEIGGKYHYLTTRHTFQIYGICEECRGRQPAGVIDLYVNSLPSMFCRDTGWLCRLARRAGVRRDLPARAKGQVGPSPENIAGALAYISFIPAIAFLSLIPTTRTVSFAFIPFSACMHGALVH